MVDTGETSSGVKENRDEAAAEEMETPDRSKRAQISQTVPRFEESPVFNFLNSLSPIKPVKSVHTTQTFNSLNVTTVPSIFTSPHVATAKNSAFLRRHQLGDPAKPEFSSDNVNKNDRTEGIAEVVPNSSDNRENPNSEGLVEASIEPSYECSKLAVDHAQSLNYDFGSPNSGQMSSCALKTKLGSDLVGSSGAIVPYAQEDCAEMFHGNEADMDGVNQIDQSKEWDHLISDAADLLNFDSPNDTEAFKKPVDLATRFYTSGTNDIQNVQALVSVGSGDQHGECSEPDNQFTQPGDGNELSGLPENPTISGISSLGVNFMDVDPVDSVDPETASNMYRGLRRRCLVFELSGARRKHLPESSTSDSPVLPHSDGNRMPGERQNIPTKTGNESSKCVLPGIGLHLNALASTSKDFNVVKNDNVTAGMQLLIAPSSASNHHMLSIGCDSLSKPVDVAQPDREIVPVENGLPLLEDGALSEGCTVNEELNQISPKKKRRRSEGEAEACKRCNCKKSKCLKLYCECFAAGVYCVEPCSCIDCFNKPVHVDTVLATRKQIESRNPLAFAPKVIRTSDPLSEAGDESSKTPASARHKRGCNCKKSGCLKKYCECYQSGVGCSINCRCEGCKNAFGRKDGSALRGSEAVLEEEETDATQKSVVDQRKQRSFIQTDTEQNPDYAPPATPLPFGRPTVHLPFSSSKPPRSTFIPVGSSSSLFAGQGFGKPNFILPTSKYDSYFGPLQEEEMPEILHTNGSPVSGVKSLSPNSKRVSPPHSGRRSSPGQRSSRKLILQSIPSFPSLTPKH